METIKEVIEDVVTKSRGFYEKNIPDNARDTEFGLQSTLAYMDIRDGKYTEDDAVDVVNRLNTMKSRDNFNKTYLSCPPTPPFPSDAKRKDYVPQHLVMGPIPALGMPYIDSGWIFYDPQATIWSYAKKRDKI